METDLEARLTAHRPAMLAFARRYVPAADAEDVVQTASVRIWTLAGSFDGRSAWLTWALAIVRNTALSHLRTESRRRQTEAVRAEMTADTTLPEEPLLLDDADRAWLESYMDGTAPGSTRTHRRKLRKIRLTLEDSA